MIKQLAVCVLLVALMLVLPQVSEKASTHSPRSSPHLAVSHDLRTGRTWVSPPPSTGGTMAALGRLPGGDGLAKSVVVGSDDRIRVTNTTVFPYGAVCKLFVDFPSGNSFIASGSLVGESLVLTAGHVLYSKDEGGWASRVEVVPGYDAGYRPYGTYYATRVRSVNGWVEDEDFNYDFGAVQLDRPAGATTGAFGFRWHRYDSELLDIVLNEAGYPGDLHGGEAMFYTHGEASAVTDTTIYLSETMDSSGGSSGGPVWVYDGSNRYVVGVDSWGSGPLQANGALRLTEYMFDYLVAWREGKDPSPDRYMGQLDFHFYATNWTFFSYDEYASYEFDLYEPTVERGTPKLKIKTKNAYAVITKPDGSSVTVYKKMKMYNPQPGHYEVLLYGDKDSAVYEAQLKVEKNWFSWRDVPPEDDDRFQGQKAFYMGLSNVAFLAFDEFVKYEFDLVQPPSEKTLKLKLKTKNGAAIIKRPDGSWIAVEKKLTEYNPQMGRYLVYLVGMKVDDFYSAKLKVKKNW